MQIGSIVFLHSQHCAHPLTHSIAYSSEDGDSYRFIEDTFTSSGEIYFKASFKYIISDRSDEKHLLSRRNETEWTWSKTRVTLIRLTKWERSSDDFLRTRTYDARFLSVVGPHRSPANIEVVQWFQLRCRPFLDEHNAKKSIAETKNRYLNANAMGVELCLTSSGIKYGESVSDKICVSSSCWRTGWRNWVREMMGVKPNLISVKYEVNRSTSFRVPTKQCRWIRWSDRRCWNAKEVW